MDDVERLYAYALTVTGDGAIASEAVHDALVVATVRASEWSDGATWPQLVALTRNECFRQMRARNRFVDTAEPISMNETDAMAALNPGHRDALALSLRTDLTDNDVTQILGVSSDDMRKRVQAANDSWAEAVQVLVAMTVRPAPCPGLEMLLVSADHEDYVWPRQRRQIVAHVKGCRRCREASAEAVAQGVAEIEVDEALPALTPIRERVATTVSNSEKAQALARRAGAFTPGGFAPPLEVDDYAPTSWLKRAVIAAGVSAALLLIALVVLGIVSRR